MRAPGRSGAAALTATFLGGQALERQGFGVATVTALAALGATLGCWAEACEQAPPLIFPHRRNK